MMRRAIITGEVLGIVLSCWTAGPVFSQETAPPKKTPTPAQSSQPAAPAPAATPAASAVQAPAPAAQAPVVKQSPEEKKREEVRAKLDGTTWSIDLASPGGGKTKHDTLTFKGRTVTSESMEKAGYGTSNYSLRVEDDGTATWETMQSKEGTGVAFWRGELQGDKMSGALSKQPTKGPAEDYSFSGMKVGGEAAPAAAPQAAPAPSQPAAPSRAVVQPAPTPAAPAAAPASKPEKKKKRGWF